MARRPLRLVLRPLLWLAALAWVPFALMAAVNLDVVWVVPSALAFLSYAAALTAATVVLALVLKARLVALVAAVGLAVLLVPRVDRVTAAEQPVVRGPELVVATSNARFGEANAAALVELVRRERVDVLAVQEDTPDYTAALAQAGLRRLLAYGVLRPEPGAKGVSLYSRYPVQEIAPSRFDFRSRGGIVSLPSGARVQVRSVHPPPPFRPDNLRPWKRRIGALPGPASGGVPTVLAGDYNATLDHHPLRRLLARGYRDAAAETGDAWRPTWSNGRWATLTIDHLLVPDNVAVQEVRIHDLPGSDHDVVVGRLRLPA